ncbi:hypothetical protein EsDP_00003341 [Epichloe bromicola]|uniref:Sulfotransferase family protein n=1 Tax=Epichloe bromicola TaxID=79588 RepID=A0ABQ0CNI9_9HYPO
MTTTKRQNQPLLFITYPRTASNLLMRMLCLQEQDQVVSRESGGYFFFPAVEKMNRDGLMRRPRAEWAEGEMTDMQQKYQACYSNLQELLESAAQQDKTAVTKEHAPFIMSPTAISDFLHGPRDATVPWRVHVPKGYSDAQCPPGLPLNPSVLPDGFLLRCTPAFLIRNPALAFPSFYRVILSFCNGDMAKVEEEMVPYIAVACTLRWTKQLYDWYAAAWEALGNEEKSPVILDADDILHSPHLVPRFCNLVGLDEAKVRFHWDPLTAEQRNGVDSVSAKTRATLHSSSGIVGGKTFDGLTIEGEAKKWKAEFGELVGSRIESWVRASMPDYEYQADGISVYREPKCHGSG